MTTPRDGTTDNGTRRAGRRGILAVAAATVAGLAARHVADAQPVAAATTDTNFTATGGTGVNADFAATGAAAFGLDTHSGTFNTGVYAKGSSYGVDASSSSSGGTGVYAGGGSSGTGVIAKGSIGVYAFSGGTGVSGVGGIGVSAQSTGNGGTGVRAETFSTGTYGMLGTSTGPGSVACSGQATGAGSYGVYGTSTTSHGVYGITAAPGASSVLGYVTARGAAAISGVAGAGAYAGTFTGPVVVNGDFVAYGGVKSGAVPHPDGSHRLLYCVESTEAWFEDFGEGKLVNGRAEVALDPDFAAVVDTSKMHVFINEVGEGSGARIRTKGARGFVVEADEAVLAMKGKRARDANDTFSYRVVAKRKDIKEGRLAKFVLPKTETAAPPVPKVAEPPKPPERGNGR